MVWYMLGLDLVKNRGVEYLYPPDFANLGGIVEDSFLEKSYKSQEKTKREAKVKKIIIRLNGKEIDTNELNEEGHAILYRAKNKNNHLISFSVVNVLNGDIEIDATSKGDK